MLCIVSSSRSDPGSNLGASCASAALGSHRVVMKGASLQGAWFILDNRSIVFGNAIQH